MAPSGNQSPRYFVEGQTFAEAERLGRKLGKAVAASLQQLPPHRFHDEVALAGGIARVDLPRRKLLAPDEANSLLARRRAEWERLQAIGAPTAVVRTAECAVFGAEAAVTLARLEQQGVIATTLEAYLPAEVHALRIGDACVVGLPGELFAEYALKIKHGGTRDEVSTRRAESMRTFVVSLVGGDLQGYVTTAESAASGGYETFTAVLDGPRSGRILVDTARRLQASLSDP